MRLDCRGVVEGSTADSTARFLYSKLYINSLRCHSQTVVQRDEWQLGCVISTLPDAVGIPPQSGSARMSLSKLREALESHPTTSPTPSHMAHGCIPSTAVSTDCRPLYNASTVKPHRDRRFVEALQLYSTLQLYSSTALYSIHPLQSPSGAGYVAACDGQYADALSRNIGVSLLLVETTGALGAAFMTILRILAKLSQWGD